MKPNSSVASDSSGKVNDRASIAFALVAVLFWATVPTAFKLGLENYNPAQLIFIASGVTLVILMTLIAIGGKINQLKKISKKELWLSALLGLISPFAYYIILLKGYSILPAQVAQPVNMTWPLILVVLSAPFLKQKITLKNLLALLIGLAGVMLISSKGKGFAIEKSDWTGIALCLGSAFIWSVYWIINVKRQIGQLIGLFLNFLFGFCYLLVFLLATDSIHLQAGKSLIAAIYIGFFEIGITFILWLRAMSLSSNNARIANLIYLAPFLSLVPVHFILKEPIHSTTIIGLFFIISGILFQQTRIGIKNKK
ncbi:MAG: DMT family transporter [Prolixibacteraceae bacterium]|nr:DMT family transporter [Prolixibacteraceae bacterium]